VVHWSSRERGEPPPARWSRCGGRVGRSGKSAGDLVEGAADPTPLRSGGARGGQSSAVEDVGVDHGGLDVSMTEEVLDGTNTCPDRRCWVSYPFSRRWVAKEWRRVWHVTRLGIAARWAAFLTARWRAEG